jgi:hypothetical protein
LTGPSKGLKGCLERPAGDGSVRGWEGKSLPVSEAVDLQTASSRTEGLGSPLAGPSRARAANFAGLLRRGDAALEGLFVHLGQLLLAR